jgi:hypothetical protein
MPTFNYSTGNINNLVAGGSAAMTDVQGSFVDVRDFINGLIGDSNLSASAAIQESKLANGATGLAKGSFSAYRAGAANMATGQIVPYDTEEWDVSGWFDVTTNQGRFTPLQAGIYRLSWSLRAASVLTSDVVWLASLRKNAAIVKNGQIAWQRPGTASVLSVGTALVQANGTTDFFDITVTHGVGSATAIQADAVSTYFQGELVGRP